MANIKTLINILWKYCCFIFFISMLRPMSFGFTQDPRYSREEGHV